MNNHKYHNHIPADNVKMLTIKKGSKKGIGGSTSNLSSNGQMDIQMNFNKDKEQKQEKGIIRKAKKNITIMWWNKGNADYFSKKYEIETMITKHQPKIFALLEANMSPESHKPGLEIEGYSLERDRLETQNIRTRTAIYIATEISYKRRDDLEIPDLPFIWIQINESKSKSWLILAGYRQWRTLTAKNKKTSETIQAQMIRFHKWCEKISLAEKEGKALVILGDLNIDVTPWTSQIMKPTTHQQTMAPLLQLLKETATKNNLTLSRTPPTRYQGSNTPSTLDILLTNIPEQLSSPLLFETSSDHKLVSFNKRMKVKDAIIPIRKARNFSKYSKNEMLRKLNMPKLNELLHETDPEVVAEELTKELQRVLDEIAPIKTTQIRKHYAPHLTEGTKKLMTTRNEMKEKAQKTKKIEDINEYKKTKNITLREQRKDKIKWADDLIRKEGNTKKNLWCTAKRISGDGRQRAINSLKIDNVRITNQAEIANALNEHFINKIDKLKKEMPKPDKDILKELHNTPTPKEESMDLMSITETELNKNIRKMKKKQHHVGLTL